MSKSNRKKAAALKYDFASENAPVVIASGCGAIADRMIELAEKEGIPVYRDDSAASLLCMLDAGAGIPPELYEIVAAVYREILLTAAKQSAPQDEPHE